MPLHPNHHIQTEKTTMGFFS